MSTNAACYLKPSIQVEPLFNQWYAWVHMIPPATAALNLANRYLTIMASYVNSPLLHVAAVRDPAMKGAPFIDLDGRRVDDVRDLLDRTRDQCRPLIEFAAGLTDLNRLLLDRATGHAMEPLYAEIPEPLQGYVELCYDMNHRPAYRVFESLLYRSDYYRASSQSLALTELRQEIPRPFVMSTPRLANPETLQLRVPFADPALDELFHMKTHPASYGYIVEQFGLTGDEERVFRSFFTLERQPPPRAYDGADIRIRYFGHACLLIQTREVSVLIDPVISYSYPCEIPRFTYADLPETIDYILITHAHHDHILPETLLQLRHKVGKVIVGRNLDGLVADPSLELMLEQLGFPDVTELRDLDEIAIPGGRIVGIPFLGEHHDLMVQSKTCFMVQLHGRSILVVADSCNVQPGLYQRIARLLGGADILFVAMECEGAPVSWIYGPLFTDPLSRDHDRSRLARGCDFDEALDLVERFECDQVYIYAMGQEPWLQHLLDNPLDEQSKPILHSRRLIEACRKRGRMAEFLFGKKEIVLERRDTA
ncbi:MAG: MBL fold metallo-hydrolase [Proteobacteria bacterium]|nr:MBL fold metallo-hydrolase [Pseudomonadota bacterium]